MKYREIKVIDSSWRTDESHRNARRRSNSRRQTPCCWFIWARWKLRCAWYCWSSPRARGRSPALGASFTDSCWRSCIPSPSGPSPDWTATGKSRSPVSGEHSAHRDLTPQIVRFRFERGIGWFRDSRAKARGSRKRYMHRSLIIVRAVVSRERLLLAFKARASHDPAEAFRACSPSDRSVRNSIKSLPDGVTRSINN